MTLQPATAASSPFRATAAARPAPTEDQPDLVVDELLPDRSRPREGERVHFQVTVSNQGTADAGPFKLRLQGDEIFQEITVPGLPAGASLALRMGPRVTDSKPLYTVRADADSQGQVDESNEDNNYRIAMLPGPRPPEPPPEPPRPPYPPRP